MNEITALLLNQGIPPREAKRIMYRIRAMAPVDAALALKAHGLEYSKVFRILSKEGAERSTFGPRKFLWFVLGGFGAAAAGLFQMHRRYGNLSAFHFIAGALIIVCVALTFFRDKQREKESRENRR